MWRSEQVCVPSIMLQVRKLREEKAHAAAEVGRTTQLQEERGKLVEQVASLKDALLERKLEAAARSSDLSVCSIRLRISNHHTNVTHQCWVYFVLRARIS